MADRWREVHDTPLPENFSDEATVPVENEDGSTEFMPIREVEFSLFNYKSWSTLLLAACLAFAVCSTFLRARIARRPAAELDPGANQGNPNCVG
jgi:hypothetical protein